MTMRRSSARLLVANFAAALALAATAASAGAQGSAQQFLPDCSPSQTTNCVVGAQINGSPTSAIKASVEVARDGTIGGYYQVYFTQPDPVTFTPGVTDPADLLCDGLPFDPVVGCSGTITPRPGANTPPLTNSCSPGPVFVTLGDVPRCGDLTSTVAPGTRVGVTVNVGNSDPQAAVIRGGQLGSLNAPNQSWTSERTAGGTVIKVETRVGSTSFLGSCSLAPGRGDPQCGGESGIADWTGRFATVTLLNLDGTLAKPLAGIARGMTLATNAQTNGPPIFDKAARTLSFQTGGPHFEQGGGSENKGFLYAFLPDSFLEAGAGFGLPPGLSPEETLKMLGVDKITAGSAAQQLTPTANDVTGGVIYSVPEFGFSSPKFDYKRLKAAGAFTSKATATKKKVSVTLDVGGKAKVSVAGKLAGKSICAGTKSASKAGSVTVACKLSSPGKKALAKARKGAKVSVKVTVKGAKTDAKSTYALIP